mmetsp:Transcript_23575/g.41786  ORF Transcript_23575/g.41786 Transcript_23575/m.41786 type:complete len:359 (-) Transcript_23575:477-1553(-)
MGGSSSRLGDSHKGALRIHLEAHEASSGEVLEGHIGLAVSEEISVSTLMIEFYGDMQCKFTEDSTRIANTRIPITHEDHKIIACFSKPLYVWPEGVIRPGQYLLPFSLRIPSDLPSSMNWTHTHRLRNRLLPDTTTFGRVNYRLSAWLLPGIQDTVTLGLHSRAELLNYPLRTEKLSDVSYWCSNKGKVGYSLEVNKASYFVGDDIYIRMTLDNSQAQMKPESFKATLRYRMHLSTTWSSDITAGILDTYVVNVDQATPKQDLALNLRLHSDRVGSLSTLHSHMIKCEFFVVVEPCNDSGCICYDDLSTELKIVVNSKLPPQLKPVPPPGWEPAQLELKSLTFAPGDEKPNPTAPPAY